MLKTEKIIYHDGNVTLEGYCAYVENATKKKPVVLVSPDWTGRNAFACQKAEKLADLGYIGFALDMYGNAKLGNSREEKMALIEPFFQDRKKLLHRILAAFETAKKLPNADETRIGAIGFCFGGLCALDLARSGAPMKGVVSFHGLLNAPEGVNKPTSTIKAKILALHGYDDPMVPPDHVITFANEMTRAKANWEINLYGNTMHAFTNPEANDPNFGTVYDKQIDSRSWIAMKAFFKEIF